MHIATNWNLYCAKLTKFYNEKFQCISGNIKETWILLKSVLNNKHLSDFTNNLSENGVNILDKRVIVEKFNEYFINIGNPLAAAIPNTLFRIIFEFSKSKFNCPPSGWCLCNYYRITITIVSQLQSRSVNIHINITNLQFCTLQIL